jgi:hypothetical protein
MSWWFCGCKKEEMKKQNNYQTIKDSAIFYVIAVNSKKFKVLCFCRGR